MLNFVVCTHLKWEFSWCLDWVEPEFNLISKIEKLFLDFQFHGKYAYSKIGNEAIKMIFFSLTGSWNGRRGRRRTVATVERLPNDGRGAVVGRGPNSAENHQHLSGRRRREKWRRTQLVASDDRDWRNFESDHQVLYFSERQMAPRTAVNNNTRTKPIRLYLPTT